MKKKQLNPRKQATQKRAQQTVGAILEATAHIMQQSGSEKLSTNQIAKKAGVSIGSLYQYFPSKESILASLIEKELTSHIGNIKTHIQQMQDEPLEEFVNELLDTIITMLEKKKRVRYLLYKFLPRGMTPIIHDIEDQLQTIIYQQLKRYPQVQHHQDLERSAYILVHAVIGVVYGNLAPHRKHDPGLLKEELKNLVMNYLLGQS